MDTNTLKNRDQKSTLKKVYMKFHFQFVESDENAIRSVHGIRDSALLKRPVFWKFGFDVRNLDVAHARAKLAKAPPATDL